MEQDPIHKTYEEQLKRYFLISKGFMNHMKEYQDKKICMDWIKRITSLKPSCAPVARDRNHFFKYFLRVMQQAYLQDLLKEFPNHTLHDFQQPCIEGLHIVQDPAWLAEELEIPTILPESPKTYSPYFAHWAEDQKTYIAVKALPGKGALVYMAVSTDPELGWSNLSECE